MLVAGQECFGSTRKTLMYFFVMFDLNNTGYVMGEYLK